MMFCANCGREIDADTVYCPGCGKEIQLVLEYVDLEDILMEAEEEERAVKKNKDEEPEVKKFLRKRNRRSREKTGY